MRVACLWFDPPIEQPLQILAERCLRLSPQIGVRHQEAIFIEFGKCQRLYSEESFKARLGVILRKARVEPRIGIGENIPDALLRAKYSTEDIRLLPLEALVDLADPLNRDVVLQSSIRAMIESFQDLGVKTLKSFQALPAREIANRFGAMGLLCQQRARGENTLPWPLWRPEEKIHTRTEFPSDGFYGELEPLLFALKGQLDSIFQRLFARGLRAQKMEIQIRCEKTSLNPDFFRSFVFDFLFPQSSTKGVLPILQERLSRELAKNPLQSPVEVLETHILEKIAASVGQKNFLHNREEVMEQLNALLGRLGEVHGKGNIFHARLTQDRRPEKSWEKTHEISENQNDDFKKKIPLRPTHLMKPEKIDVNPGHILIRRKSYRILSWTETQERISGGWVENSQTEIENTYHRDYFIADLEGGLRIFCFKDIKNDFYLHGIFG